MTLRQAGHDLRARPGILRRTLGSSVSPLRVIQPFVSFLM